MKKIILFIALIFCSSTMAFGSHVNGAEINYTHVSGNDYIIRLKQYIDFGDVSSSTISYIHYGSTTQNVDSFLVVNLVDSFTFHGICPDSNVSTNNSWQYGLGLSKCIIYEGIVTLNGGAPDWRFFFQAGRDPGIINIGSAIMSVFSTLNNLNNSINNNVQFDKFQNRLFGSGLSYNISFGGVDIDGDSLDYKLITPYSNYIGALNLPNQAVFINAFTNANPFSSLGPIVLNSTTGILSFTPDVMGANIIAIQVDEYRNGVIVGSTIRDLEFHVFNLSANSLPDITGGSNNNSFNVNACGTNTLSIPFVTTDIDLTDSTFLWWDSSIAGATFATIPGQNETGTFNWTPTSADVRPQPYLVTFVVRDNKCPVLGLRSYTYKIFVNQCSTDSVWAGDANADFTCNNYDILAIGIANGSTGPLRVGATTNWQAEYCAPWANSFLSTINYRHADCNGDGTVNSTDLASVTLNYGQIHFKNNNIGHYKTAGLPDLFCDVNSVQAVRGTTLSVPIMLGKTGSVMNDFYGIAGTVELLNAQTSTPISITNNNSWIGDATNSFAFEKSMASNKSAFTLVRNDQQNVAVGQGQIGTIEFPIDANSVLGSQVVIQFSDLRLIDKGGNEIVDYNVLSDTLTIVAPTSVIKLDNDINAVLFPNPTNTVCELKFNVEKTEKYTLNIYDPMGRVVRSNVINKELMPGLNEITIDVSSLSSAIYLLELKTENKRQLIKLIK